ncbi:MAG TPA: S8 family serine peptidase, partial [Sumerlaeia bacterium]|nr:S8 family serine peptidase [Sumerlaeia bacterium]
MIGDLSHPRFGRSRPLLLRAAPVLLAAALCVIFPARLTAQDDDVITVENYPDLGAVDLTVTPRYDLYEPYSFIEQYPEGVEEIPREDFTTDISIRIANIAGVYVRPENAYLSTAGPSHARLYLIPESEMIEADWYDPTGWTWGDEANIPGHDLAPLMYTSDEDDPYLLWTFDWDDYSMLAYTRLNANRVIPSLRDEQTYTTTWRITPWSYDLSWFDQNIAYYSFVYGRWVQYPDSEAPWWIFPMYRNPMYDPDRDDDIWQQVLTYPPYTPRHPTLPGVYYLLVVLDMFDVVPEFPNEDLDTLENNTFFWRRPIYFQEAIEANIQVTTSTYQIPPPTPTTRPSPTPTPSPTPAEEGEGGGGEEGAASLDGPPFSLASDVAFEDQGADWLSRARKELSRPLDPEKELFPDYIVVRIRRSAAARAHAERLVSSPSRDALWTKRSQSSALSSFPRIFTGLRPFTTGIRKAQEAAETQPAVSAVLARNGELDAAQIALATRAIAAAAEPHGPLGLFHAKLAPGVDPLEASRELIELPDVVYAHPAPVCHPYAAPNDPLYSREWGLRMIEAPWAWDIIGNDYRGPQPGASLRVCVVDTGVRVTHSELAGRIADPIDIYPYNGDVYADDDPNNDDPEGHGTACAGIIAAIRDNANLVSGIAPVTIIPVSTEAGKRGLLNYEDGVMWGVDRGARVINLSLGGSSWPWMSEWDAAEYARDHEVIVCAAAGNSALPPAWLGHTSDPYPEEQLFWSSIGSPAVIPTYICVGAVDQTRRRVSADTWWWGSDYGLELDICAPGQGGKWPTFPWVSNGGTSLAYWPFPDPPELKGDSIVTLDSANNGAYTREFNGTSAATPHVAGVAALMLIANPMLTADQLTTILLLTATDRVGDQREDTLGWDAFHGYGLVNARAAVEAARGRVEFFDIINWGTLPLKIFGISAPEAPWLSFYPKPPFEIPLAGRQQVMVMRSPTFGPAVPTTVTLQVYSNDEGLYWDARKRKHVPKNPLP